MLKNVVYPIANQAGALMSVGDTMNASYAIKFNGNTDVTPDKPLYIRAHWANDEITPYLLDYLQANYPNAKKIAVAGVTEACTPALYDWLKDVLAARVLERVGDLEQIAPDTSDYNPPVTRLLSAKPDAIFVVMSTPVIQAGFVWSLLIRKGGPLAAFWRISGGYASEPPCNTFVRNVFCYFILRPRRCSNWP
jgi:hypothetical protein